MPLLSSLRRLVDAERGPARLARPLARIRERLGGRWRAWVAGWPQGFIGASPRIIGTAYIHAAQRCSIGRHAWIEAVGGQGLAPRIELGERFSASERLHIACVNRVSFGPDCLLGSSVHVTDHNHGSYKGAQQSAPDEPPIARPLVSAGAVEIGSRVWIGDNCVILGPARIGDGAVVGANSVVSGDVPGGAMVAGVPARIIKSFNSVSGQWERGSHRSPQSRANLSSPE